MNPPVEVDSHDHMVTRCSSMAVDHRVELRDPEDRDIDHTVRSIRMQMTANDRHTELNGRVTHPLDHLITDLTIRYREDIHHREGPAPHRCDIMDIHQHSTV